MARLRQLGRALVAILAVNLGGPTAGGGGGRRGGSSVQLTRQQQQQEAAAQHQRHNNKLRGASKGGEGAQMLMPEPSKEASLLSHLVLVAGHAVTVKESLEGVDRQDDVWYLLPYQRQQSLPGAFVSHIKAGVEEAAKDTQALLVFSGGQTRVDAGPASEAVSYYHVAQHFQWWGYDGVRGRALAEEYARDSFENLLFSICRFKEYTGNYPSRVTVVSFAFKRERFENYHRAALRYPSASFHYIGIDPPPPPTTGGAEGGQAVGGFDLAQAKKGEYEKALKLFRGDPYGCHSQGLQSKRLGRDPFRRTVPYPLACPDMAPLLHYCATTVYPDPLPWAQ